MIHDTAGRLICEAHLSSLPHPDDIEYDGHVEVLENLAHQQAVEVAIDSEYQDTHTLSIQTAMRIGKDLAVQIYRSSDVPPLAKSFRHADYLPAEKYGKFFRKIIRRPVISITPDLSPARMLLNLLEIKGMDTYTLAAGRAWLDVEGDDPALAPDNADWNDAHQGWTVPTITIRLIGHFLTADLGHAFGAEFLTSLFNADAGHGSPALMLQGRKNRLTIVAPNGAYRSPAVEYIQALGNFYRVVLEMRDTMLPFGPGSLERHSQTFLGIGKCQTISDAEKGRMLETFRARPADVYGYGMVDAVNTLLLYEQMVTTSTRMYRNFGFDDNVPNFQPTMGSRVARFLEEMLARSCAESTILSKRRNLKKLLRQGGLKLFQDDPRASRYGAQTAGTHGGLLFNRSPTCFWHEAPGQLRDVDMSGCYAKTISRINLYCGRPLIHEPGDEAWSLKKAVEWAESHAEPDAWIIRATGDLESGCNSLILSTLDAKTVATWKARGANTTVKRQGSKMFSARIESGIVTHASWAVIQAMPQPLRSQYEALTAESIVLYPRILVAESGARYDELVAGLRHGKLGWDSNVDLRLLQKVEVTRFDDSNVSIKFPIRDLAQRFVELRQKAKVEHGKGSGMERAWKEQVNTLYGTLASEHLPTQNIVAANLITATARANAWVMAMVLNAVQTITDGCTYRRDQIPACTFAECLRRCPDYPLRRPEGDEIPFLDPAEVPENDTEFTLWLQQQAKWFFQTSDTRFTDLLSLPTLEHKQTGTTGSVAFDALACDSSGNYLKCASSKDGYQICDAAMRGYGPKCRQPILDWVLATYQADRIQRLCPVVDDSVLLKLEPARQAARRALQGFCRQVYFPLGLAYRKPRAYKALKLSAFVFRTPSQQKKLARQEERFARRTGCGLELVCFRRPYGSTEPRRLSALASELYDYIQSDGQDLPKKFHLNRLSKKQVRLAKKRMQEINRRRDEAGRDLRSRINAKKLSAEMRKTGIYVTAGSLLLARQ